MGDFFKGWRRRAGLLALILAILIMCAWFSSYSHPASFVWNGKEGRSADRVASRNACIVWEKIDANDVLTVFDSSAIVLERTEGRKVVYRFQDDEIDWNYRWCGLGYSKITGRNLRLTVCRIPYWLFVLVPTAVSAYLLLSPTRPATEMKDVAPVPESVN